MKILRLNYLLLCGLIMSDCSQSGSVKNGFILKGTIADQDTGMIVLRIQSDSLMNYDTVIIDNGKFIFRGIINEPKWVEISMGTDSNRVSFYIDPGLMNIDLTKDKFNHYKLSGSKSNDENLKFSRQFNNDHNKLFFLQKAFSDNQDSLIVMHDEKRKLELEIGNKSLKEKIDQAKKESYLAWLQLAKNYPSSYILPDYLLILLNREYISLDSAKVLFNILEDQVKTGSFGHTLAKYIQIQENTSIGALAPDFKAIDINGNLITLSQFRGKNVVLIEFWASWCGPCRSGFPFLKSLDKKYNDRGFEIIAIDFLDSNSETWKSAIIHDKIENWHHLATSFQNEKAVNPNIYDDYPFGPVPFGLLVDKNGRIIGSWKGHSTENEKEVEALLLKTL